MPTMLARNWDSWEGDEYFVPCKGESKCRPVIDEAVQKQWLSELSVSVEHECMTIFYAKTLYEQHKNDDLFNGKTSGSRNSVTELLRKKTNQYFRQRDYRRCGLILRRIFHNKTEKRLQRWRTIPRSLEKFQNDEISDNIEER
ncbi:hypothetical protein DICVIV_01755 [Dictyocaulus viviparus]|uniref:Uncharacterized protein n=1 Tax=Dictyocaulus viviparus TaxID=29172 RepID=A0A0D8Y7T3_DICVI|nr:hypothetical protein DICVIV_01755 [Dictyocaulus viviparus]